MTFTHRNLAVRSRKNGGLGLIAWVKRKTTSSKTTPILRQRSSSLTDLGMVTQNHQTAITVPVNETSISREVMSQEDNHYIAPPPWQRVPNRNNKKRKFCDSSPDVEKTTTANRFSNLPLDPSDETCSSNVIKPSKPPPIVLNGIEDVNELSKLLQTASDKVNFKFKLINKNLLHILVSSAEEYKKIITTIRAKGLIGHTFTPKTPNATE
ncbi:hypothetical protein EVAR_86394_1 [Eumeta japonica]|uniref:Nucleic-acid-binding protein from transposon X-element n=1 Tax=Eumeta variegata TaxID=151549 RepID=A0A4C1WBF5_EUMVA|nr:hypothetical protein EVAR_86394_1 [Eumeta japonica]